MNSENSNFRSTSERNSFVYYDFRFPRHREEKDNWITSRWIYPKTAADKRQADNNSIHDLFEFLYLYNETKENLLWVIIDKKVSTSFQPPSGRNLFKLFVPEYFVPNRMFEYVSTYKNLFIRREERKKAIVEYLIKRINERSLFVHRQTRRWIGLFASSCKVGTILLTVPRPCHKVTLYRVFLVTRASAYFAICQSRVSARGNAKLSGFHGMESTRGRPVQSRLRSTTNEFKINLAPSFSSF